jgi:hypothetical protein
MNNTCKRLFFVPPSAVFEHPPDLPTAIDAIPVGPIEGWECYGPNWEGNPAAIVGPFNPVVVEEFGAHGTRWLYIRDNYRVHAETEYWFLESDREAIGRPDRPCWHQSGCTLRFVRKRGVSDDR